MQTCGLMCDRNCLMLASRDADAATAWRSSADVAAPSAPGAWVCPWPVWGRQGTCTSARALETAHDPPNDVTGANSGLTPRCFASSEVQFRERPCKRTRPKQECIARQWACARRTWASDAAPNHKVGHLGLWVRPQRADTRRVRALAAEPAILAVGARQAAVAARLGLATAITCCCSLLPALS